MHPTYSMSQRARDRALRVRGQLQSIESLEPAHTSLIVVDMQNYFLAAGAPGEVPAAREIVPAIHELAAALRPAGATIVVIQTDGEHAMHAWPTHHLSVLSPQRAAARLAALHPAADGFALYPS